MNSLGEEPSSTTNISEEVCSLIKLINLSRYSCVLNEGINIKTLNIMRLQE